MKLLNFTTGALIAFLFTSVLGVPTDYGLLNNTISAGRFLTIVEFYLVVVFIVSPALAVLVSKKSDRTADGTARYMLGALPTIALAGLLLIAQAILVSIMTAGP